MIKQFFIAIAFVCVLALGIWGYHIYSTRYNTDVITHSTTETSTNSVPEKALLSSPDVSHMIHVFSPKISEAIPNPIHIQGEAAGTWFFEGVAPVAVVSEQGVIIGQGQITTQSDWMTTDLIPFVADIAYEKQVYTSKGYIIFSKSNPSGESAKDMYIKIPITLKP